MRVSSSVDITKRTQSDHTQKHQVEQDTKHFTLSGVEYGQLRSYFLFRHVRLKVLRQR
jgi:hypothetical protein